MYENVEIEKMVRDESVHKKLYTDPAIFALEMERIWSYLVYVGHESQAQCGDYTTTFTQDVIMVRAAIKTFVLYNRCPHKGFRW